MLDENQGWLLLSVARGRGHPVTIPGRPESDKHLEWMESLGLISVKEAPDGWRCAILARGREALREWRARCTEKLTEPLAVEAMR